MAGISFQHPVKLIPQLFLLNQNIDGENQGDKEVDGTADNAACYGKGGAQHTPHTVLQKAYHSVEQ